MAIHPAEEATIRAFVVSAKRERLIGLFGSRKRRSQALDGLNHFAHWDSRYSQDIKSCCDIAAILRSAGAPDICHLISDDPKLDGEDLPLHEAVSAAEDFCFASVLCCLPGELAFYFDEDAAPRNRVLLRRPGVAR